MGKLGRTMSRRRGTLRSMPDRERLALLASALLGWDGESHALALTALVYGSNATSSRDAELGDTLLVSLLDVCESEGLGAWDGVALTEWRTGLERRRGPKFVEAVRIRYSEVNLARLGAALQDATQWCGKCDVWRRRYLGGHRHRSSSGRRFAWPSLRKPGSARPSSSGSMSRASTPLSSKTSASPNTPSEEPAAPSSVRPSLPRRRYASFVAAHSGLGGGL